MFSLRFVPGFFAQIFAAIAVPFAEEQGVKLFAGRKGTVRQRAGIGAMFDRPIVGERVHEARAWRAAKGFKLRASRFVERR